MMARASFLLQGIASYVVFLVSFLYVVPTSIDVGGRASLTKGLVDFRRLAYFFALQAFIPETSKRAWTDAGTVSTI
jgi:hypothetical protein